MQFHEPFSRICRAPCGDGGGDTGNAGGPGSDGPGPDLGGWGGPDTVGQNPNSGMGEAQGNAEGSGNGGGNPNNAAAAAAKIAEKVAETAEETDTRGRRSRKGARFDNAILGVPGLLNARSNTLF